MQRREFLSVMAAAAAALAQSDPALARSPRAMRRLYDVPRHGNVHLLHFTHSASTLALE